MAELPLVESFICNLQKCRKEKNLTHAKRLHMHICNNGLDAHRTVGNYIVPMFVGCGSVPDAQEVFNKLVHRSEHSWTSLMLGYIHCGKSQHTFNLYQKMQEDRVSPSTHTLLALLKACARLKDVERGREVHADIAKRGFNTDIFVSSALVDMYAKCDSVSEARRVFDKLPIRNVVSWSALIAGYAEHGPSEEALKCFEQMQLEGISPDAVAFASILKACGSIGAIDKGREIHKAVARSGLGKDLFISNTLIDMYAKCGSLSEAREVFDKLPVRDVVSWSVLISGYAEHGRGQEALNCFEHMRLAGISPDAVTFFCILKACGSIGAIVKGREIHGEIKQKGFEKDLFVSSSLIDMYAKCGSMSEAREVFEKMIIRNVVSWSALIAGYAKHGPGQEALKSFEQMQLEGVCPNAVTFVCILKACGNIGAIDKGRQIHIQVTQKGLERDPFVGGSLVDMYAKCGSLSEAWEVFDKLSVQDVVSWSALIAGYAEHGPCEEALNCFEWMQKEGISPDAATFVHILKACGKIRAIDYGREVHLQITGNGLERDLHVGSSLVDMYAKCGSLAEAQEVFDKLPLRDVVSWSALIAGYVEGGCYQEARKCLEQMQLEGMSPNVITWNALIAGYAEHGPAQEAFKCFQQMQVEGISPSAITYACIFKACGSVGAVDKGREIHKEITQKGLEIEIYVGNSLVDMYAKCGALSEAREVFDKLSVRDVVSWAAMINGYGMNHEGNMAVQSFEDMKEQGVRPDAITFTCLLTACSRAGMVSKGQEYFEAMRELHGIVPGSDHYTCMVDLLARSGHLSEAEKFLDIMLCPPSTEMWKALLSACKTYGEAELGLRCFQQLVQMNPDNAAPYVLMANIYASAGRMDDAYRIEELRKLAGAKKKPAIASIEVNKEVHAFMVGGKQSKEISAMLEFLNSSMKKGGHVPNLDLVLREAPDKEKDAALCEHAEKLALAFGLLNTPQGQTLHLVKNMRMCNNCHNANKNICRIEKREIIVRDSYCVHHFKDGLCSCALVI